MMLGQWLEFVYRLENNKYCNQNTMTMTQEIKQPKRRNHLGRNVTIVGIIVVVAAAGAFVAYSSGIFGPSSSIINKSSPLSIVLGSVIDDQPDATQGNTIFVYNLTITDNSQSKQYSISPSEFQLVTSTNSVYNSGTILYWGDSDGLSSVTLSPGLNTKGNIAFEFPLNQAPSYLMLNISGSTYKITDLPSPDKWVSEFNYTAGLSYNNNYDISTYSSMPGFLPPDEYLNGQLVPFTISFSNLGNANITVNSITVSNSGLQIYSISPSLPISVYSDYYSYLGPSSLYFHVNITAPQSCFIGTVIFNISLS